MKIRFKTLFLLSYGIRKGDSMARVTASEVKEIIVTEFSGSALDPFITAANLIVTEKLSDVGLSNDLLKEIERWLAAHFIYASNPTYSSTDTKAKGPVTFERVGETARSYGNIMQQIRISLGVLSSTVYGQQALILDMSGTLASLGKKRASVNVLDVINV